MNIEKDKIYHFLCCLGITIISAVLIIFIELPYNIIFGFCFALIIGVCKELYDKYWGTTGVDLADIIADCIGAFIGVLILIIYYYII